MKDDKPVYVIGDVHGDWTSLKSVVTRCDIADSILVCVGDLGIGFKDILGENLVDCKDLNNFFRERDVCLLSIRGNHDDPSYFNGPNAVNLSHFKLLPDYHVEIINGQSWLFVGGACSIDRCIRTSGKNYWPDESFVYDANKAVQCDVLVTHSAPSWIGPSDKSGISGWCARDKTLWKECVAERVAHDKLFESCTPKKSYHGHFHISEVAYVGGCLSSICNTLEIKQHIL